MGRLIRELLPLAVVTVVIGAVTLWLLVNNPAVGQWALAAILFGHGWVHVMFLFPRPDPAQARPGASPWPFDLTASWLVTRAGARRGAVRSVGRALVLATFAMSILATLATLGWLVPAAWWTGLVLATAAGSALLLGLCFSPTLILGLAIDAGLAWLALAGPWSPAG